MLARAEESDVRCADPETAEAMLQEIRDAGKDGDTLGGVFEVLCLGVPPGLGSHVQWDRRLTGKLLGAVASIPAVKAVEIGPAFDNASRRGSEVHGAFDLDGENIERTLSRSGGLEGGITTGEAIAVRGAMKPIATTIRAARSVDLQTGEQADTLYERSDVCAVPRAAVVAEAMVAFVLADSLLLKLGGDTVAELTLRHAALRTAALGDLPMDGTSWRMEAPDGPGNDT
jgi:chorismate synthase